MEKGKQERERPATPADVARAVDAALTAVVRAQIEGHVNAATAVLQERLDEIAGNLSRQIQDAMEEHRRTPHVGGQRLDDLAREIAALTS